MFIVHVSFQVKEEHILKFKKASIENAKNSIREEGVVRFDVLQQQDDPSRFVFAEAYKTPEDQLKHRETEHFKVWRSTILDLLKEPYTFNKYDFAYPEVLE
jgi:autoinducer 2-degrading protein